MGINGTSIDLTIDDNHRYMLENFSNGVFNKDHLTADSYYIKAAYSQSTVDAINKKCRLKFPKKSFTDLEYKLRAIFTSKTLMLGDSLQGHNNIATMSKFYNIKITNSS
jgi:hypothetical protein